MADIVLSTINAKWIHPSLALRLLKANLPPVLAHEKKAVILEFALRQRLEEKISAILAEKPKILALSVSIWNHEATLELLQALEIQWAGAATRPAVILGGPEITPLPPGADIFSHADFVIRGEGEAAFAELCGAILEDPAAAKKRYGTFIAAGNVNLAAIKNGYGLYTGDDLEHKLIYVESTRGCPYSCAFCQSAIKNDGDSAAIREFPLDPFLADLERLLQRCQGKTRTIKFLDRSFNVKTGRALRILDFCLTKTSAAKKPEEKYDGFQFHFEMVPGIFPAELRDMLISFPQNSIRLEIGIQSLCPKTCELIQRTSNPGSELEVLRFLREKTNVILHVDLIAGLPGEDLESFGEGFDRLWMILSKAHNTAPFEIQLGILKCLPGTPIHTMAEGGAFSVRYNAAAPYEVIETESIPVAEMEKIKNFARFWEQIVNRRPFPVLLPLIVPPGEKVFDRFMELSEKLLDRFGKNWGIPKQELEEFLEQKIAIYSLPFFGGTTER